MDKLDTDMLANIIDNVYTAVKRSIPTKASEVSKEEVLRSATRIYLYEKYYNQGNSDAE